MTAPRPQVVKPTTTTLARPEMDGYISLLDKEHHNSPHLILRPSRHVTRTCCQAYSQSHAYSIGLAFVRFQTRSASESLQPDLRRHPFDLADIREPGGEIRFAGRVCVLCYAARRAIPRLALWLHCYYVLGTHKLGIGSPRPPRLQHLWGALVEISTDSYSAPPFAMGKIGLCESHRGTFVLDKSGT